MKLGNLKALRESLGMTQKEFAATLGIGVTTYNGYETGARDPKSEFWVAVAQKYSATTRTQFLTQKKSPPPAQRGRQGV